MFVLFCCMEDKGANKRRIWGEYNPARIIIPHNVVAENSPSASVDAVSRPMHCGGQGLFGPQELHALGFVVVVGGVVVVGWWLWW